MGTRANIKIEPMKVIWGTDTMQVQKITCTAATSLNNKYFYFYDSAGAKHYAWFNVNSTGSDPAPDASATAHVVALATTNDTATQVATALTAVLTAVTGFDATSSGAIVTLTHTVAGFAQKAHDGNSTFTFELTTEGDSATDAGFTDGSIEVSSEEDLVDVTSHQTGSEILSHIRTGNKVSVTVNFKETTISQLRKIFRHPGDSHTPSGASGTEVFGLGSSRQFDQTIDQAKKLNLHPVVLESTDYDRDVTFWLAYPRLDSLAFSGEEILTVPVTFDVYRDTTKNAAIDKFCIGDATQTLT